MPAIIIERPECKEEMWKALRRHIIQSRRKKKEELAEEEAEERQRKLQEEQYKKDRMTLGETKNQIHCLESHLRKLKDDKHQLFLQLKKVLNEENASRHRRARVDMSEHSQPYSLVSLSGNTNTTGHQQQLLLQPQPQLPLRVFKVGHNPGEIMAPQDVVEDSRRGLGEYGGRAVLWNKRHPEAGFYPGPHPGQLYTTQVIPSVAPHHVPLPSAAPPTSAPAPPHAPSAITTTEREREREQREREQREREREREQREREREQRDNRERERERERERDETPVSKPGHVQFIPQARPPSHTPYPEKFYPVRPASHVPIHGGVIPIQNQLQGAKTGSITSGYPVRSPAPPPSSQHASPHASPQPPTRPTTFQPAGPVISSQSVALYPHRLVSIPITSASSGLPTSLGHLASHPGGHAPSHPSSHPNSHLPSSHPSSYPPPGSHTPSHPATNHVTSHPTSHTLSHSSGHSLPHHASHSSHPSHPSSLSHPSSHPPSHVVSHPPGHGSHPHSLGHTSVLHSSHQQVHVNVSQGHPLIRLTMSNMPRES